MSESIVLNTLAIIIAAASAAVACKLTARLFYRKSTGKGKEVAVRFLSSLIDGCIYIVAAFMVLNQLSFFRNIMTGLTTGSGLLVILIAFIAQEALADIISGLLLISAHAFDVGDVIVIKDQNIRGSVKAITLNHTEILSFENNTLIIPNKIMKTSVIENLRSNNTMCNFLSFTVAYNTDLVRLEEIIRKEIHGHPYYIDARSAADKAAGKDDIGFLVTDWAANGIKVRVSVWTKAENGFYILCDLRRNLLADFAKEGIELPYPHVQVVTAPTNSAVSECGVLDKTAEAMPQKTQNQGAGRPQLRANKMFAAGCFLLPFPKKPLRYK